MVCISIQNTCHKVGKCVTRGVSRKCHIQLAREEVGRKCNSCIYCGTWRILALICHGISSGRVNISKWVTANAAQICVYEDYTQNSGNG